MDWPSRPRAALCEFPTHRNYIVTELCAMGLEPTALQLRIHRTATGPPRHVPYSTIHIWFGAHSLCLNLNTVVYSAYYCGPKQLLVKSRSIKEGILQLEQFRLHESHTQDAVANGNLYMIDHCTFLFFVTSSQHISALPNPAAVAPDRLPLTVLRLLRHQTDCRLGLTSASFQLLFHRWYHLMESQRRLETS